MEDIEVKITGKDSSMTVTFTAEQHKAYLKVMEQLTEQEKDSLDVFQILEKVGREMDK